MTPTEMNALIEQGPDAMRAALASGSLSAEELQIVQRALSRTPAEPEGIVERVVKAVKGECELCSHPAHTGPCPWRTDSYYCDCGMAAGAAIPEERAKTKK